MIANFQSQYGGMSRETDVVAERRCRRGVACTGFGKCFGHLKASSVAWELFASINKSTVQVGGGESCCLRHESFEPPVSPSSSNRRYNMGDMGQHRCCGLFAIGI